VIEITSVCIVINLIRRTNKRACSLDSDRSFLCILPGIIDVSSGFAEQAGILLSEFPISVVRFYPGYLSLRKKNCFMLY
jgi:hypothetical protein